MRAAFASRRCCKQHRCFKLIPLCLDLVGAPIKRIIIVDTVITFCESLSLHFGTISNRVTSTHQRYAFSYVRAKSFVEKFFSLSFFFSFFSFPFPFLSSLLYLIENYERLLKKKKKKIEREKEKEDRMRINCRSK